MDSQTYAAFAYWLLLLDQHENGVWGRSIDNSDLLYGLKHDLGSISVSVNCALAISAYVGRSNPFSVGRFRDYLATRRRANGAFGMMRSLGSADYPEAEILAHSRHTAGAINFFSHFDGHGHPFVTEALGFLLNEENQTEKGLWVDFGERLDERVDPVTIAAIVECCNSYASRAASGPSNCDLIQNAEAAVLRGLGYIFNESYITDEGMWVYRFRNKDELDRNKKNAYRYTMGIASSIVPACIRLQNGVSHLERLQSMMHSVFKSYNGFLPISEFYREPSVSTTANWMYLSEHLEKCPSIASAEFSGYKSMLLDPETLSRNTASGWAAVISQLSSMSLIEPISALEDDHLNVLAKNLQQPYANAVKNGDLREFILKYSNEFALMRNGESGPYSQGLDRPKRSTKILFLAANPRDTAPLDLEDEFRTLLIQLQSSLNRDSIEVVAGHAVQPDDLVRLVRREAPNVIHFSGHADPSGIALRDGAGGTKLVESDALAAFLAGRGVKLVVLNACFTGDQALHLLRSVSTVVGTTNELDDEAALKFTAGFYLAIGDGRSIGEAFRDGRDNVSLSGLEDVFHLVGDEGLILAPSSDFRSSGA